MNRRHFLSLMAGSGLSAALPSPVLAVASGKAPIRIGLDAEFGHQSSTSAIAIRLGILTAAAEINEAGGALGGRPFQLIATDNRSVPARGIFNTRELAATPDLVAMMCGKFSPVVLECLPIIHELKLPLLNPWAAADAIIDNGYQPNYAFRLSLRDSWTIPVMGANLKKRGLSRIGVLLPNTAWGRSNQAALKAFQTAEPWLDVVAERWYNWGDPSMIESFLALRQAGAQAVILVANESEGSILVRQMAELAQADRLPILSHWGVSGGDFRAMCGPALDAVDFAVVQTFTFAGRKDGKAATVLARAAKMFDLAGPADIKSQVGFAHAYDLTHLLALAVNKAGTTDRPAIRDALEDLPAYDGLIRTYQRAFSATDHEALAPKYLFLGRFGPDGVVPLG